MIEDFVNINTTKVCWLKRSLCGDDLFIYVVSIFRHDITKKAAQQNKMCELLL